MSEGDGVVYERDEAAAAATRTIHADDVEVAEVRRASGWRKFGFL